jgi:glycosyltransferase involved in cell wall biosynthesis
MTHASLHVREINQEPEGLLAPVALKMRSQDGAGIVTLFADAVTDERSRGKVDVRLSGESSIQGERQVMRILFVADTLGSGGKERQLVELLKGLDKRPDVAYSLCLLSSTIDYSDAHGLKGAIHIVERKFRYDPTVFFKLYRIAADFKADIVQSWELMCSIYSLPVAKVLGLRFVNAIRNAPERLRVFESTWIRSKLTFPFSDGIVANSEAGLRSYGIGSDRGTCIHNGFDLGRLRVLETPEGIRERFGIRTPKVVGMVAKFHPKKDNETFIRAATEVCSSRDDVTFLAIGTGKTMDHCRRLVRPAHEDRIRFLGRQLNVESLIRIFDVGVLATFTEGISNSVMEYMALSKPVVVTDGGGTRELVLDRVTGFLVPRSDPGVMAEKIQYLLDNPQEASQMGQAGRTRLETHFNLERMTKEFVDTYARHYAMSRKKD